MPLSENQMVANEQNLTVFRCLLDKGQASLKPPAIAATRHAEAKKLRASFDTTDPAPGR
jgi:hypothetical protein